MRCVAISPMAHPASNKALTSTDCVRRRGLGGIDLNKPGDKESKTPIPEALGLATGCVFLIAVVSFQALYAGTFRGRWHRLGDAYEASWQVRVRRPRCAPPRGLGRPTPDAVASRSSLRWTAMRAWPPSAS